MFRLPRLALTLTALVGIATSFSYAVPAITGNLTKQCWSIIEIQCELERTARQRAELVRRDQSLLERIQAKRIVIEQLLDGDMTLQEAGAKFQEISCQPPEFNWKSFRRVYEGDSDMERFCRQVIAHAEVTVQRCPDKADRLVDLHQQLEAIVAVERSL